MVRPSAQRFEYTSTTTLTSILRLPNPCGASAPKGLLLSDQALFSGTSADSLVQKYTANSSEFFKDFAEAMIKMGNIEPLTGKFWTDQDQLKKSRLKLPAENVISNCKK